MRLSLRQWTLILLTGWALLLAVETLWRRGGDQGPLGRWLAPTPTRLPGSLLIEAQLWRNAGPAPSSLQAMSSPASGVVELDRALFRRGQRQRLVALLSLIRRGGSGGWPPALLRRLPPLACERRSAPALLHRLGLLPGVTRTCIVLLPPPR